MLANELAPGALTAPRRGRQAMTPEHLAHSQMGAAQAQLEQLALDAPVSPAGVLNGLALLRQHAALLVSPRSCEVLVGLAAYAYLPDLPTAAHQARR